MDSPGAEEAQALPSSLPLHSDVDPLRADSPGSNNNSILTYKRLPMARPGFARKGVPMKLLTNHFRVNVASVDDDFFHYSVSLSCEDGTPVDVKAIGRKIIDRLHETYDAELAGKDIAYDGNTSLFTVGPLPHTKLEFTVVLKDFTSDRIAWQEIPTGSGNSNESKRYKVVISYASKIPMKSIANTPCGQESENFQQAFKVLGTILRQNAAKQGCLLVRESFFQNSPCNICDLGGDVLGCSGIRSSFRATQGGLSLNLDVSTTMIIQPGPVLSFLVANQNVRDPNGINWAKAKRTLKNLRINTSPSNFEYKITGLSKLPCNQQMFPLKQTRDGKEDSNVQTTDITVYDYFVNYRNIELQYSAELPCIIVGKPKHPVYIPLELCSLLPLQRYTKALSTLQKSSLIKKSTHNPQERMTVLSEALKTNDYDADQMLHASKIQISTHFTQLEARVLSSPKLKVGNGEDLLPQNGRWNFHNKKVVQPTKVQHWAIVNFSARCDVQKLWQDLVKCGQQKGIVVEDPLGVIEENPQARRLSPLARVEQMFAQMKEKLLEAPRFLLCLLPERPSTIYGPWKRKSLTEFGIITQCISPTRVSDQYLTNVLLKINVKLGGLNYLLDMEHSRSIPLISEVPTIIFGMDVSHGSSGQSNMPSIAAVVSSRQWPLISCYRASVRTQSPKVEMINSLFKPVSATEDEGIVRELLLDFYATSGKRKADQVLIFRDGVSDSQFIQVLNIELDQIIEACKFLDENWCPKFTVIVAQKNHHTIFFQEGSPDNIPPGTVIDKQICHPQNNDFYMCSHAGKIGIARPTHYHVLYDEIGFSSDDLQEFVHSLSYVDQRSTTAVSVVAPICYAHLAAYQMAKFMNLDEISESSSGNGGVTSVGSIRVPELPQLHPDVSSSMFFC